MNEFKTYHPIVNFVYFLFVIGLSMFIMQPMCIAISFVCAFFYSVLQKGTKAIKQNTVYMLPMMILTALINTLFNHKGVSILCYFPNGNPLTMESLVYGICAAGMLVGVICWFSCFNEVMTSDKILWLFGKTVPKISLLMSMSLRFIPLFAKQLRITASTQKCLGFDSEDKNIIKRMKNAITVLSSVVTWALENAVETADSMKARGYGIRGRTSFSVFKFDKRDLCALLFVSAVGIYVLTGFITGKLSFSYFPAIKKADSSFFGKSVIFAYFILCVYPIGVEIREKIKWNVLKSKI